MNQPALYHRANVVQRYEAEVVLKKYSNIFQWRLDGQDSLIDIGSGSGDVLKDFIYPLMPRNFARLVGSDISSIMCNYARQIFKAEPRCDFRVLDIATGEKLPDDLKGQFDHVTSFYCLHWVQNQRQALENIYQLLRPEKGDCLLLFPANNTTFEAYLVLRKSPKWSSYMTDVERFIGPFCRTENLQEIFATMLREAGFTHIKVELRHDTYDYKTVSILKDNMEAVCPFLERMIPGQRSEFLQDLSSTMVELNLKNNIEPQISVTSKLIVAYARKTPRIFDNATQ
uniref:Methyltransf_12 domain-containing protein n=1 Tax=Glossina austeni TaxID=7395 RepID=A0A1A9VS52_GLOAU